MAGVGTEWMGCKENTERRGLRGGALESYVPTITSHGGRGLAGRMVASGDEGVSACNVERTVIEGEQRARVPGR